MVWPHPRDVILYARSSYYYDNMFIICLFLTFFLILKPVLVFYPGKFAGTFAMTLRFLTSCQHVFRLWFHACNLLYVTSPQKQVTDFSLVLKDSDMDSENLSSLTGFLYQMARKQTVLKSYQLYVYNNNKFLVLMSPLSQYSVSEVEF